MMKLSSKKALEFLENAKGKTKTDAWIKHSICVGNVSGKIAKELKLDEDKAKALGYIHDIGKAIGPFHKHVENGYKYLKELGYDEETANICLVHPYLNNDINCTAVSSPNDKKLEKFIKEHKYTMYEKIINLADLLCTDKICTIEERLGDIYSRYGIFENSNYHKKELYKIKKHFDDLLGFDLYELILEKK